MRVAGNAGVLSTGYVIGYHFAVDSITTVDVSAAVDYESPLTYRCLLIKMRGYSTYKSINVTP